MSYIKVEIEGKDFSNNAQLINSLNEYSDESAQFGGIIRRGNIIINFDNNDKSLDSFQGIFRTGRNHKKIKIQYIPNNPRLNPYLIFEGVIDEGTTEENIKEREISLSILDYIALLGDYVFNEESAQEIDKQYFMLRGSKDIQVNKHFIACFLFYFFKKDNYRLNNIMKVFKANSPHSYPSINAEIESIFPPADSYYEGNNKNPIEILTNLCSSINSYAVIESSLLKVINRPITLSSFFLLRPQDFIDINSRTTGFNKLYNSISINDSDPFYRQSSIDRYGVRELKISSYAAPSQALADSYLDYYSEPKEELDCSVKMNHFTLAQNIGNIVQIKLQGSPDQTKQSIDKKYSILSRSMDFNTEVINWRLREV